MARLVIFCSILLPSAPISPTWFDDGGRGGGRGGGGGGGASELESELESEQQPEQSLPASLDFDMELDAITEKLRNIDIPKNLQFGRRAGGRASRFSKN
mmetsp:Transcript_49837/g.63844  ORF Transcript_49837/g.63844 Transcript_49837/m.63844 type:complete len:99 (+) Transcript_49837:1222-1518(+)